MPVAKPMLSALLLLLSSLFLSPLPSCDARTSSQHPNFTSIYQLGDSLSDTGNLIRESAVGANSAFARLPYGVSFFKRPTGRCCDGLLMVDFIAKAVGLPHLNPYLNKDAVFAHGVNFAVAGATALPAESLAAVNISNPITNSSLGVQIDWMWSYFNSICYDDSDCAKKLQRSLFIVGGIGSSDYYHALSRGKAVGDLRGMAPDVVQAVVEGARRVLQMGASKVIVPGIFPLGCFPAYLSASGPNNTSPYDEHGCSTALNSLSTYHNARLERAVRELGLEHRNATIIYGDYYNAFRRLLQFAPHLGFDSSTHDLVKACCGTGGPLNFDRAKMCGTRGVPVCANPDSNIVWDGFNLTQRAYRLLARWLVRSTISKLNR